MIDYHVISTGSKGNAVLIHGIVLIAYGGLHRPLVRW